MAAPPSNPLTRQARRQYADQLVAGLKPLLDAVRLAAQSALEKAAEHSVAQRRRDTFQDLAKRGAGWLAQLAPRLRALADAESASAAAEPLEAPSTMNSLSELSLLDDDTLQRGIQLSRVNQAIRDRAVWEHTELRSRILSAEGKDALDDQDIFQFQTVAEAVLETWTSAGLGVQSWTDLEDTLLKSLATWVHDALHETNQWLIRQGLTPQVDLRSLIRRTPQGSAAGPGTMPGALGGPGAGAGHMGGMPMVGPGGVPMIAPGGVPLGAQAMPSGMVVAGPMLVPAGGAAAVDPHTGMALPVAMAPGAGTDGLPVGVWVRGVPLSSGTPGAMMPAPRLPQSASEIQYRAQTPAVRLWLEQHIPGIVFDAPAAAPVSPELVAAIGAAQRSVVARLDAHAAAAPQPVAAQQAVEELRQQKEALKQEAKTPVERATVEIVALMFQSILTEDRIPPSIRVWFARLQMPVLRVAIAEPDFFAASDHPARRLIDRMGSCAMGFDNVAAKVGPGLESEVKRIVQVVEAFPDTGRRVFQTVLTEFEKFLEDYFRSQNEQSKQAVTIAQQVEQREILAIQYTIELRKMLDEVRVHDGVRHFLFQIWADVMATAAVRHGVQHEDARAMKRVAGDLVWAASPKMSREERSEVIRRLPPLLKALRAGMNSVGLVGAKQDEALQAVNKSLTTAFAARASGPAIPAEQLDGLKRRLEELEEVLPADEIEFDDSYVLDLTGDESEELEVVADGGSKPSAEMLERASELLVGEWFKLDYRGRVDAVQLAWHGMKRQLSLFVSASGRCVLFPKKRLAAFMEAGLLVAAQAESLTAMATRQAIAKIDADPERLAH